MQLTNFKMRHLLGSTKCKKHANKSPDGCVPMAQDRPVASSLKRILPNAGSNLQAQDLKQIGTAPRTNSPFLLGCAVRRVSSLIVKRQAYPESNAAMHLLPLIMSAQFLSTSKLNQSVSTADLATPRTPLPHYYLILC